MSNLQSNANASNADQEPLDLTQWLLRHLPVLLYGWFWFGMVLCGLLAPIDRVQELESSIVTEGWHLSLMATVFGSLILFFYWLRITERWK